MRFQRIDVAFSLRVLWFVVLICLFTTISGADSLELRDGRHLHGKYVGGTSTAVSFMADGIVQNLPVSDVLLLVFGEGSIEAPLGTSTTGSERRRGNLLDSKTWYGRGAAPGTRKHHRSQAPRLVSSDEKYKPIV